MNQKRTIVDLEKILGFRWQRGIYREAPKDLPPAVSKLFESMETLKQEYVKLNMRALRDSPGFSECVNRVFDEFGGDVWPRAGVDRSAWLVNSSENDWSGLYPRDLHFDDVDERRELHEGLYNLTLHKVVRYHENHLQAEKRAISSRDQSSASPADFTSPEDDDEYVEESEIASSPPISRKHLARIKPKDTSLRAAHLQEFVPIPPTSDAASGPATSSHKANKDNSITVSGFPRVSASTSASPDVLQRKRNLGDDTLAAQIRDNVKRLQSPSAVGAAVAEPDLGKKRQRSPRLDQELVPGRTLKRANVRGFHRPNARLLVKLKLTPQKLGAAVRGKEEDADRSTVIGNDHSILVPAPHNDEVDRAELTPLPEVKHDSSTSDLGESPTHVPHEMHLWNPTGNPRGEPEAGTKKQEEGMSGVAVTSPIDLTSDDHVVKREAANVISVTHTPIAASPSVPSLDLYPTITPSVEATQTATRVPEQPITALQKASVSIHWDVQTIAFMNLRRCNTYEDFFNQLRHRRPQEMKHLRVRAARVILTNFHEIGISERPDCWLDVDDGEDAFIHLTETLSEFHAVNGVRPKLRVTVEFEE